MKVELSETPGWLKITWSFYDASTEAEILRRLATVGALGNGRRWYAPVSELWTLTTLFDKASYSYEAMQAADAPGRAPDAPTGTMDAKLELLGRGIQNAKKKADEEARYPVRRRKAKKGKTS